MKMASTSIVAGGDAIFVLSSVIRGHHIYKTVWSPSTGEILEAVREPHNPHDHHAVCLRKTEVIVGHGRAPPPSQGIALSCGAERACFPFWPSRSSVRHAPITEW